MSNKRKEEILVNKTKFLLGFLACVLVLALTLVSPGFSSATTFTLVKEMDSGPIVNATFLNNDYSTLYSGGVYSDYLLITDVLGSLDAFCVENAFSQNGAEYELLSLLPAPTDLQKAAWVAHEYWYDPSWGYTKGETQVAIWEIVLTGRFVYHSGLSTPSNVGAIVAKQSQVIREVIGDHHHNSHSTQGVNLPIATGTPFVSQKQKRP